MKLRPFFVLALLLASLPCMAQEAGDDLVREALTSKLDLPESVIDKVVEVVRELAPRREAYVQGSVHSGWQGNLACFRDTGKAHFWGDTFDPVSKERRPLALTAVIRDGGVPKIEACLRIFFLFFTNPISPEDLENATFGGRRGTDPHPTDFSLDERMPGLSIYPINTYFLGIGPGFEATYLFGEGDVGTDAIMIAFKLGLGTAAAVVAPRIEFQGLGFE